MACQDCACNLHSCWLFCGGTLSGTDRSTVTCRSIQLEKSSSLRIKDIYIQFIPYFTRMCLSKQPMSSVIESFAQQTDWSQAASVIVLHRFDEMHIRGDSVDFNRETAVPS